MQIVISSTDRDIQYAASIVMLSISILFRTRFICVVVVGSFDLLCLILTCYGKLSIYYIRLLLSCTYIDRSCLPYYYNIILF